MAAGKIILFDLRSRDPCAAWSLNPWKTRLLLNYKGIDYETHWLDYPDIRPRLEGKVAPNSDGMPYTIPTVAFEDGDYMMDSRQIAQAIEKKYPEPPIYFDSPYQLRIEAAVSATMKALLPVVYPLIPKRLLTESSSEYWHTSRSARVGMKMDEFEEKMGGEKAFRAAEASLKDVTLMLKENTDGPFLQGAVTCYADFVWAAFLVFAQRIGQDVYDKVLERTGDAQAHARFFEACRPWLERDSK